MVAVAPPTETLDARNEKDYAEFCAEFGVALGRRNGFCNAVHMELERDE